MRRPCDPRRSSTRVGVGHIWTLAWQYGAGTDVWVEVHYAYGCPGGPVIQWTSYGCHPGSGWTQNGCADWAIGSPGKGLKGTFTCVDSSCAQAASPHYLAIGVRPQDNAGTFSCPVEKSANVGAMDFDVYRGYG